MNIRRTHAHSTPHFSHASTRAAILLAALAAAFSVPSPALAHVDWTAVNQPDPTLLGLYHFDETAPVTSDSLANAAGMPRGRNLVIGVPDGVPLATDTDLPESVFGPRSLHLNSGQITESTESIDGTTDLTIEFWFKWPLTFTGSQSFEVGLRSGPKLRIARDSANPANDFLGVSATHDDVILAPGFTNWADIGEEEGGLGEWRHVALTIHSTGMHHDDLSGHDVYNAGTIGRIFLNGHATGADPHTFPMEGLRVHDCSTLRVRSISGEIQIDEVAIWSRDWSGNGAVSSPFPNGRGTGSYLQPHEWTRLNAIDPKIHALYHFDAELENAGEVIAAAPGLAPGLGLVIPPPDPITVAAEHDTPAEIFDPHSIHLEGPIMLDSTDVILADRDLTIEFWLKFEDGLTSTSMEAGLRSGVKIRVARNSSDPARDYLGISATHGDLRPAPGFTDWSSLGVPLGVWVHVAVTVHVTGYSEQTFAEGPHDAFNAGSTARFFVNNRPLGNCSEGYVIDMTSTRAHPDTRVRLRLMPNQLGVLVEEFTVWGYDWAGTGADLAPFWDGRGNGMSNAVKGWALYD